MSDFVKLTTVNSVPVIQELSASDISTLADYLLYLYATQSYNSKNLPYVSSGNIAGNKGQFLNTYLSQSVGTHPATGTVTTDYYSLIQDVTPNNAISTITYPIIKKTANTTHNTYGPSSGIGNSSATETISEILTTATGKVSASANAVGSYYIASTGSNLPEGSTTGWQVAQSNAIPDTVVDGTTTNYTLYRKIGTQPTPPKILKRVGGDLKEFEATDFSKLVQLLSNQFVTSGINHYQLTQGTIAPTTPVGSTWQAAGTLVNTIRTTANISYAGGIYAGTRNNSYFRGAFTGPVNTGVFTSGSYATTVWYYYTRRANYYRTVNYTRYRNATLSIPYYYTRNEPYNRYRESTAGVYYTGFYHGTSYAQVTLSYFTRGTGYYNAIFSRGFARLYGVYNPTIYAYYTSGFTGSFFRGAFALTTSTYFTRSFARSFFRAYSFVGTYIRKSTYITYYNQYVNYVGSYATTYSSLGVNVGSYSTSSTFYYARPYTRYVNQTFTRGTGWYTGSYAGNYNRGNFTGLTVQSATTSTTYTLWKRTA